jgi:hypothetical protein
VSDVLGARAVCHAPRVARVWRFSRSAVLSWLCGASYGRVGLVLVCCVGVWDVSVRVAQLGVNCVG